MLGLSFLFHDLGMALAAWSEGFDGIRRSEYYRDAVALEFQQAQGHTIRPEDWEVLDGDISALDGTSLGIIDRALANTLRNLHAKKAETLVADAIQIDDRRAPSFEMALRKPDGESKKHWVFQNKLNKPTVREERLYFTSKSSFKLDDMEAWWLCHDTLRMVDRELRDADTLLMETHRTPKAAEPLCLNSRRE